MDTNREVSHETSLLTEKEKSPIIHMYDYVSRET